MSERTKIKSRPLKNLPIANTILAYEIPIEIVAGKIFELDDLASLFCATKEADPDKPEGELIIRYKKHAEIVRELGISKDTITKYIHRIEEAPLAPNFRFWFNPEVNILCYSSFTRLKLSTRTTQGKGSTIGNAWFYTDLIKTCILFRENERLIKNNQPTIDYGKIGQKLLSEQDLTRKLQIHYIKTPEDSDIDSLEKIVQQQNLKNEMNNGTLDHEGLSMENRLYIQSFDVAREYGEHVRQLISSANDAHIEISEATVNNYKTLCDNVKGFRNSKGGNKSNPQLPQKGSLNSQMQGIAKNFKAISQK